MEILQMNNQELDRFLRRTEQENPLIELKGGREEPGEGRLSDVRRKLEWLDTTDAQNRVYYDADLEEEDERCEWGSPREEEERLGDYVFAQLQSACTTPRDREILLWLTDSLDERGYLGESEESLKKRFSLREVELYRYLTILQSAEPAGVGARNLVECLLLQMERMEEDVSMARRIVIECLELLGEGDLSRISARMGISLGDVQRCAGLIRRLNPKPGSGFASRENLRYIFPDVTVVKFRDYLQVLVNDTAYPQIRISRYYRRLLEQEDLAPEARAYIENGIRGGESILAAIARRNQVLAEITRGLAELQKDFFEKGPGYRRAMSREELAACIGMDPETLAMGLEDKYLQCTWGIYPLSYFFLLPAGAETLTASGRAAEVKEKIREILAAEDRAHPLGDRQIAEALAAAGVEISRRTVTKYRSAMGIPEAGGRREG